MCSCNGDYYWLDETNDACDEDVETVLGLFIKEMELCGGCYKDERCK
jgi:hypothetical protein